MKNGIKSKITTIALGLGCLLMAACCSKKYFGVDEAVWSTLTEQERHQVIEGYNKTKEEKEKNALIHESAKTVRSLVW